MRHETPWKIVPALAFALAFAGGGSACSLVISTDDLQPAGDDGAVDSGTGDVSVLVDSAKDAPIVDSASGDSTRTDSGIDSSSADTHLDTEPDTAPPPDTTPPPDTAPVDTGPPCTLASCGGRCVDTMNDPGNCGLCGKRCDDDQECVSGSCQCRTNLTACGTQCADLVGDDYHCGACAVSCSGTKTCVTGACVDGAACPGGRTMCIGTLPNSGCFDLKNDPRNCGTCTTRCRFDEVCANGVCRSHAPATTGCTSAACTALLGASAKCCPSSWGADYCVAGIACPGWF